MKSWRVPTRRLLLEELEGRLVPSTTGTNWSGYAVTAAPGTVTAVSGSWVVPTFAKGSASGYSASWVGIDGYTSNSVEQIGTEADYSNGQASYYAWYEMYPSPMKQIALTVHGADTISASVTYAANGFTLSLTDVTSGQSYSTTKSAAGAQRSSAEWVMEAPWSGGVLPLDGFGTETFSRAKATINGASGPIDASRSGTQVEQINMVNQRGSLLDTTGGLTDSSPGSSFTVTSGTSGGGSGSGGSGSGHHRGGSSGNSGWGWWWFSTMQSPTSASQLAVASTLMTGTSSPLAPTVNAPAVQSVAVPTPAVVVSPAGSSVGLANLAGGGGSRTAPVTGAAPEATMPEVPADGNQPATPSDRSTPDANPDAAPMPPADPEASADSLACDACFIDGRWAPAAPGDGASATLDQGEEDGASLPSVAGVLFALSLGGSWGLAREQAAERRRRQRLR